MNNEELAKHLNLIPDDSKAGADTTDDKSDDTKEDEKAGATAPEPKADDKTDDKSGEDNTDGDDDFIRDDDPEGVVKRIGKVTKARRTAERENAELRERNAYLEGLNKGGGKAEPKAEPDPEPIATAPSEEDFDNFTDYVEAVAKHSGIQAAKDLADQAAAKEKTDATKAAQDAREEAHKERLIEARDKYSDFEEIVEDAKHVPINEEMYQNIVDLENGPDVAYYIAKNPEEGKAIYNLDDPRAVAREIARIAAKVAPNKGKGKGETTISGAPDPISGGSGGKAIEGGLRDDEPIEVWMNKRNAEIQAKKDAVNST